jgi:ankyrin repeat protein
MRLLNTKLEFCDYDDKPPPYAILSHTWSEKNEEEVTYQDLKGGTTKSLLKLELCKRWAEAANLEYFWIDTCCIDKRNDAEINYAIRSMWRWYSEAVVCFVYLSDLSRKRKLDTDRRDSLKDCRWFTRGWTLQELVASKRVEFHARDGHLGSREDLLPALKNITGINPGDPMPDQVTRLSWVAKRTTKRPEDKAYCMLGICDVSLDPRYGEGGESAWQRLQDAIIHRHGTSSLQVRGAATNLDHHTAVLEALRFDALETRRKTVKDHLAKTCNWILSHPACAKWMKLEHKFFWIKGKPGAGKSVLIKYLDQYITRRLKKSRAIGLYFYFNARGTQLERSFLGLYRSLLVQLVDRVPELTHKLDALNTNFDLPQLQSVLASAIRGLGTQIWLFIDALDECREGDVQELIDFLDELHETELYVCFASRHYPIVKVPTELQLVLEEVDAHKQDLSTYVERLGLVGEELIRMQHDIVAKANGIFLWVVLVVGILQKDVKRARFHAMQSRLREIPEGLPALFKTIIFRDDEHKEEFLLCLRWIIYARRSLTLKEWYFAMMSGVDGCLELVDGVTDHRMETFLLSSSKGLAELTKGKTITTQFIHESVRDFLVHQSGLEEICGERDSLESTAHEELKHCCLRAMAFDLPRQLEQRKHKKQLLTQEENRLLSAKYPFAEYATTYVLHHADQAAVRFCQQHFLANQFTLPDWVHRYNAFQKSKPDVYSEAPNLTYLCAERDLSRLIPQPSEALSPCAQRYRTPLVAAIVNSSWEVVRKFLNEMSVSNLDEAIMEIRSKPRFALTARSSLGVLWRWAVYNELVHLSKHLLAHLSKIEFNTQMEEHRGALYAASERGYEKVVQMLLAAGADVNAQGGDYGSALQAAAQGGHEKVVQMLIAAGADVNAQGGEYGSALQAAAQEGHEKAVQTLLAAGADVNAQKGHYDSALYVAAQRGHEKVVQMLIAAGPGVNAWRGQYGSALYGASQGGHEKAVQTLLAAGADVNARRGQYGSALYAAAQTGRKKVVQMLIAAGADVNAQGGQYGSALQAAAQGGHEKVVQILIAAGADVNARRGQYGSALQAAAQGGHEKVVQTQLAAGADVNAQGGEYGSALQAAAQGGYEKVVQMLIAAGADVNAQGGEYGNALYGAAQGGQEEAVQMLLTAGADVNAQGGHCGSALHAASAENHEKVVQMLIAAGADVNQGGHCGSALHTASQENHEKVVQMLIAAGADVNAQGGQYGSALQMAAQEGHEKAVQTLLAAGADVNAQGRHCSSALYVAAQGGHEKAVQILIAAGADVNAWRGQYGSALYGAAQGGHEKAVQILIAAGADVNAQGGHCGSALHAASQENHEKVVQMLRAAGAR